ncbi:MAG: YqiA/YcfP family alpha/beta fold hydrolase [Burkholderiaceae bacterium]
MAAPLSPKDLCLIYAHGFRSSPKSSKAMQLAHWMATEGVRFECPALDIAPLKALDEISHVVENALVDGYQPRLIGSSLGGFYVSWFMERHPQKSQFRAALINPACWPARDLIDQVGPLQSWHGPEILQFQSEYIDDLKSMEVGLTDPHRYMLVAAKGDTVLDWNEMVDRYPGCHTHIVEGSDHSLSDFADHWPAMKAFLFQ